MMSCIMSEGITPPSSLILAHAPDQNPPAVFDLTITTGLCRLPQAPAGRWPFPTLSLQSLRRCLDPYPAVSFRCTCPLLPGRQRPHLKRDRFGTPKILPAMQLQQGRASRGCSHSLMFGLPRSLDPQVAPTAESQSLQGGWAVYTTHSSVGYLPRDVASLRVRHEQLTRLDFHQLEYGLVGRSPSLFALVPQYLALLTSVCVSALWLTRWEAGAQPSHRQEFILLGTALLIPHPLQGDSWISRVPRLPP